MPYSQPPIKNRFSSTNQPIKRTPRGASPTTELKELLEKKINYEDPETKQQVKGKIAHVIALRLILNACQGENEAIKEIFNRIDGKISDILIDQSKHTHFNFEYKTVNEDTIRASQSTDGSVELSSEVEGLSSREKIRKDLISGSRIDEEGTKPTQR